MDLDTAIDWLTLISIVTGALGLGLFALSRWLGAKKKAASDAAERSAQ